MRNVGILEASQQVQDGVDAADVAQKLIAEPLAAASSGDQAGDVDELQLRRRDFRRFGDCRDPPQALVLNRYATDVRLDGAKREIGGRRSGARGQSVEQRGLADVRQSDDTAVEAHLGLVVGKKGTTPRRLASLAPSPVGRGLG